MTKVMKVLVPMILGIDISKSTLDVMLFTGTEHVHQRFNNTATGIAELLKWLLSHRVSELHVCLEATNIYWEEVAEALYNAGYKVSVVNPRRIKGFGMSQMQRNKTDKADSEVIAAFCAATEPAEWQPPTETQRKLRAWQQHRLDLKKSLTQHKNRQQTTKDQDVKASLQRLIDGLEAEVAAVEKQLEEVAEQCQAVRQQRDLLLTIKGIGVKSAHVILALLPDLESYKDARAVAADVGVTPAHYESGTTVHKRTKLSKMGKAAVRGELYMPALIAMRTNPILFAFAQRLRARGKPEPVIIGAIMRKLLHICYGVLKHKSPFDPNYGLETSAA
jgi:transposase